MLSGDNGILQKATDAKTQTGIGQEKETIALAYNSALAKKVSNGNSSDVTDSELDEELDSDEATASGNPIIVTFAKSGNSYSIDSNGDIREYTPQQKITVAQAKSAGTVFNDSNTTLIDDYKNEVVVPKGFKIASDSATTVAGGVVIEDATYTNTLGSQFVWIPVGTIKNNAQATETFEIQLNRYSFSYYDEEWNLIARENPISIEQDNNLKNDYVEETTSRLGNSEQNATSKGLEAFISSVNLKGGYYIGRYEARTTTERTASGDATTQLTEKSENSVYNWVTQLQASERSRNMYSNNENFETDLINSYSWDTAIVFLQKFDDRADTSTKYSLQTSLNNSLSQTGTTIDKICNLYDMSSNCCEWTTETSSASEYPCTARGGQYDHSYGYTSFRHNDISPNSSLNYISFRPILYVK